LQFFNDHGGLVHQPDFPGGVDLLTGEEGDGGIDGVLLLAEVEDVAVGLGAVEDAIGAGERLNQAVMLEVFIHIERVQVFGIEAGEEHVHHDGNVDFLRMGQVGVGPLLILDAPLHILIVEVELADGVIGSKTSVILGDDPFQRRLLPFGVLLVVLLFLREILLNLEDVFVALGRRGEDAGDV
jgi:hypothetical protein